LNQIQVKRGAIKLDDQNVEEKVAWIRLNLNSTIGIATLEYSIQKTNVIYNAFEF